MPSALPVKIRRPSCEKATAYTNRIVARERLGLNRLGQIPESYSAVGTGGGGKASIGSEVGAINASGMARQTTQLVAGRDVPKPGRVVEATGQQLAAIRREPDAEQQLRVAAHRLQQLAGCPIPDLRGLVPAAGGNQPAIGRECGAVDRVRVSHESVHKLASVGVVEHVTYEQLIAVWRHGHALGRHGERAQTGPVGPRYDVNAIAACNEQLRPVGRELGLEARLDCPHRLTVLQVDQRGALFGADRCVAPVRVVVDRGEGWADRQFAKEAAIGQAPQARRSVA